MPITSGIGQNVNIYAGLTGSLPVTSTISEPVWVTGTVTAAVSIPSITTLESSVGATGALAPLSATMVGGLWQDGNIYPVAVDSAGVVQVALVAITTPLTVDGLVGVSGAVAITSGVLTSITNPVIVTSTQGSPVWITSSQSTALSITGTLPVTGLVGVTGVVALSSGTVTAHVDGLVGVTGTVQISNSTGTLNVGQTGSFVVTASLTNPIPVFISGVMSASFTDTMTVTSSLASPVWTTGTTTIALTGALPVTGLVGISGTVAITSGVLTSVTNPVTVTSTFASPVYVSSTLINPVNTVGLHGVTGTVAVSSGVITAHADGLVGVTGAIAITSGVITAHSDGLHGVTGTVAITSGVLTSITNTVVVTSTVANPSYVTSTITSPVNVTASQNSPVTIAVTGVLPVTGTVTVSTTSSLVTVGLHGVTGTVNVLNSTGVLNVAQTGAFVVTGTTTIATTGTLTVSQSNPVLTASVAQTGAWVVTGTVTQNVPAFPSISGAITNAGDIVTLALGSAVGAAMSLEGTFSGNIRPQVSYNNGADWHIVEVVNPDYRVENLFTRVSSSGIFLPYYTAGATHIRLSATAMASGQASVYINTSNSPPHVDMTAVEDGEGIPKYGNMVGGNDGGFFRFVKVDQSGALYVSASQDRPVWITGVITSVSAATGTFVAVENSVGGDGQITPVSATLVGGHNTGNLQSFNVTPNGTVVVTGTMTAYQTGAFVMTATQANPVWITGSIATTAGTQIVTSTFANPVWITGTSTVTGTVNVFQTGALQITGSTTVSGVVTVGLTGALPVTMGAITGTVTVAQTGAWVVTGTQTVTASQGSPVTVAITGTWPVTGTVTIGLTSSLATTTNGLVGVTGAVAITSGVLTSITNTVVMTATLANPAYVTSTAANPISSIGLHGVTGTVAISSGVLTSITNNVHTDGLMGVSGTVAISSGALTTLGTVTNPVTVTSTFASPVYVSSTSGNPVNTVGLHGVSGTVAITSGVLTSITNTVVVTSTVASPVHVTASSASPVSVAIIGAIAATNAAALPTATLNPVTGTLALAMNGNTTIALSATAAGFLAVSMTNPASAGAGTQYGSGVLMANATGTLMGGAGASNDFQAITAHGTNFDAEAVRTSGALEVDAHLKGYNGTTFDRVRTLGVGILQVSSTIAAPVNVTGVVTLGITGALPTTGLMGVTGSSTPSDAFANPTTALLAFALGAQWDGTQWVRTRGGVSGTLVQTKPAATSAITQVAVNGNTVVTLLAANTNRLGATIQNAGSSTFASHVKLGTVATLASYTVRIAQNGYYEVPSNYNGAITAINSGSQVTILHVTEITQ